VSRLPVKLRLTLAFAVVMAVVLGATGLFVYLRHRADLDGNLNDTLRSRGAELARLADDDAVRRRAGGPESFAEVVPRAGARGLIAPAVFARAERAPVLVDRTRVTGIDGPVRLLARPARRPGQVLVVADSLRERDDSLASLATGLVIGGLAALLFATLAGWWLASSALGPVDAMRRRAADISQLGDGTRLPVPAGRDEIAQLGDTLNEMLDRLERSALRERGFVANASHELRTPLTLLRGELELALQEGRSPDELRAAIVAAAEESDRLAQLADDLLVLARADQGRLPVRPEPIATAELLEGAARRFARRAQEAHRELRVEPADIAVSGDRLRAEQALGNLVDNALRYGSGPVVLSAVRSNGNVALHVCDGGPGFDAALLENAFERFTRGDRGQGRGGAGLGLAIVEAVAEAHGCRAGAANRPEGGADAWVELPTSQAPHPAAVDLAARSSEQPSSPSPSRP
jgi:two-component system, OmpR family, sensor kinase